MINNRPSRYLSRRCYDETSAQFIRKKFKLSSSPFFLFFFCVHPGVLRRWICKRAVGILMMKKNDIIHTSAAIRNSDKVPYLLCEIGFGDLRFNL